MAAETESVSSMVPGGRAIGIVFGTFSIIATLAAFAYIIAITVVDWIAIDILAYPTAGAAPFVVITGAILTIPIVVPTVFVSVKRISGE